MPKGPSMRVATLWLLVARRKRLQRIMELRASGFAFQEIADLVDLSRRRVSELYAAEIRRKQEIADLVDLSRRRVAEIRRKEEMERHRQT